MNLLNWNRTRIFKVALSCCTVLPLLTTSCGTGTSDDGSGGSTNAGTGGQVGTGGNSPGTGGQAAATGGQAASGGQVIGSGGQLIGSGGDQIESGGSGSGGAPPSSGGAGASGGALIVEQCSHECVEQCEPWGGTVQDGLCEQGGTCCEGATAPAENPFAHLAASAEATGQLLANRFAGQTLRYSSVSDLPGDGYKDACEWYGALAVAKFTMNQSLLDSLVSKFDPLKGNFVNDMKGGEAHVDRYIYGMVPLEIYLQTQDQSFLSLGTDVADEQQVTNQTRNAIDDMFMMTGLQLEAYRATGESKYIDFMSGVMVQYLGAQRQNGLFYHNVNEAQVHWGRGNGWFAAGMAEMIRDLPTTHMNYAAIETGYTKMLEGLLPYQSANGLWYQVLDMPDSPGNWEETSSTAMFTYAMIAGVRRGILDAETYVPVVEAAWAGLQTKINPQGDVSDICVGTWYHATPQDYMALTRLTGDGHGQAPVLWAAAEILR